MSIVITRLSTHRCQTRHKTESAFIRCWMRNATQITGSGPFALVSWCSYAVALFADVHTATTRLVALAADGCGARCHDIHRIYLVELS